MRQEHSKSAQERRTVLYKNDQKHVPEQRQQMSYLHDKAVHNVFPRNEPMPELLFWEQWSQVKLLHILQTTTTLWIATSHTLDYAHWSAKQDPTWHAKEVPATLAVLIQREKWREQVSQAQQTEMEFKKINTQQYFWWQTVPQSNAENITNLPNAATTLPCTYYNSIISTYSWWNAGFVVPALVVILAWRMYYGLANPSTATILLETTTKSAKFEIPFFPFLFVVVFVPKINLL